jgi:DnaK suppressor protein
VSVRVAPCGGRDQAPGRVFYDDMRAALESARDEIRRRRPEINVERVAEAQEQSAILTRNEMSAQQINRDRQQLRDIEEALQRLTAGSYGICNQCSTRIPERRLRLVPTAEHCVRCQEHIEQVARMDAEAVGWRCEA